MSNETMFYNLCHIMANIESIITSLEKIGLIVEPGEKGTVSENLYASASEAYRIASSLLEYPNVDTENNICNELLSAGPDTMEEIAKKVWDKYGIK